MPTPRKRETTTQAATNAQRQNAERQNAERQNAERQNAERQAAWRKRQAQAHKAALAAKGLPASPPISNLPGTVRWKAQHVLVLTTLEAMRAEMQSYFDDRTERWKDGERGEAMTERLEQLDDIIAVTAELPFD